MKSSRLEHFRRIRRDAAGFGGGDTVTLSIGDCHIRLLFGSPPLRDAILPAFQHLLGEGAPALSVHLHDLDRTPEASKMAEFLAAPAEENALNLMDGPDLTCFTQAQGKAFSAIDWDRREAHWVVRNADDIPYIERSAPLRPLLTHLLASRRQYLAHAAVVGEAHGGVLILGHGGAGKSTTALVCLEAGMEYVSDDHCLIASGPGRGGAPVANSLFSTGKLALQQLGDFPALAASAALHGRPVEEKVALYLTRLADRRVTRQLPLRAMLLARIAPRRETVLRPLGRAEAFRAIAPSCALHFLPMRTAALECFRELVAGLPAYVLELGADRRSTPASIRALLADLPAEGHQTP